MAAPSKSAELRLRAQQAKEFLIAQVVEEAQRTNVSLSEVEQKMLHFTETEETLPDIYEVNDQFDREYDSAEYEKKIAGLLRSAYRRNCRESPEGEKRWKQAIADLHKEDHYLLVMVDQSRELSNAMGCGLAIAISIAIILLIILWVALDERGLAPTWIFAWISDDPLTRRLEFTCVLLGVFGIWLVLKLARVGALGGTVRAAFKLIYNIKLANLKFLRPSKRPRQ